MNRAFFILLVMNLALYAQSDYFYTISENRVNLGRGVHGLVVNSQEFRPLPDSPYLMEDRDTDQHFVLVSAVSVSDPGPFFYATRQHPNQIYMYRRLPNGRLSELPDSPLSFINEEEYAYQGGFTWMEKHPFLPVLYQSDFYNNIIRFFRIQDNGHIVEFEESPFDLNNEGWIWAMDIHPDGDRGFYSSQLWGDQVGLWSFSIDPDTGAVSDTCFEEPRERPVGVEVSDDGRFLYTTSYPQPYVFIYEIDGRTLRPSTCEPFFVGVDVLHVNIKGRFMTIGTANDIGHGLAVINENGCLEWAPGSPVDDFAGRTFSNAFSPFSNRVFFSGDPHLHVYDYDQDGRLTPHPENPIYLRESFIGAAGSMEDIGDPYSLEFSQLPSLGDTSLQLHGDPNTPFSLVADGVCLGNYVTDEDGFADVPLDLDPNLNLEVKVYCEDDYAVLSFATTPFLKPGSLMILLIGLGCISWFLIRNRGDL